MLTSILSIEVNVTSRYVMSSYKPQSHFQKSTTDCFWGKNESGQVNFFCINGRFFLNWNSRWIVRRPTSIIVWPSADSLLCLSSVGRHLVIWNVLKCRPADPVWRPKIDQRSTGLSGDWFWQIGWRTTDHIRITLNIYRR